jgi:hypothetical protein
MDVRSTLSGYIEENKNNGGNHFIQFIKQAFLEGNLDHNKIRRAVLQRFKEQDKTGVIVGSLLLQMDSKEINELLNEKL